MLFFKIIFTAELLEKQLKIEAKAEINKKKSHSEKTKRFESNTEIFFLQKENTPNENEQEEENKTLKSSTEIVIFQRENPSNENEEEDVKSRKSQSTGNYSEDQISVCKCMLGCCCSLS